MSSSFTTHQDPEYVWQLATLFPGQGEWTDSEYLDLTDQAKRRIEFTDGHVEFLTMPTEIHEALVRFLFLRLYQFVDRRKDGEVYANGIRVRVRPGKYRLPDVLFLHRDHFHLRHNRVWDGADMVMEVVSEEAQEYFDRLEEMKERRIEAWHNLPSGTANSRHLFGPRHYCIR